MCSATSNVFQITAVAFSTFLNRLAAAVRSRAAANGDSTGFVVRRCFQYCQGVGDADPGYRLRRDVLAEGIPEEVVEEFDRDLEKYIE